MARARVLMIGDWSPHHFNLRLFITLHLKKHTNSIGTYLDSLPKRLLTALQHVAPSMAPEYPPALSDAEQEYLLSTLKDWSIAHGLAVRPAPSFVPGERDPSRVLATTAPVTLFPSLFPRACFDQGRSIQLAYNELYSAIARDEEWLKTIVEE